MGTTNSDGNILMMALTITVCLIVSIVGLTGCSINPAKSDLQKNTNITSNIENGIDPIIRETLSGLDETQTPIVKAEIAGYLVDWIARRPNYEEPRPMFELAVMKNGSFYRLGGQFGWRASAYSLPGRPVPKRLEPESLKEKKARIKVTENASKELARQFPEFINSQPLFYGYMIRVYYSNGKSEEIWVDPDVENGRIFKNVPLEKWPQ